MRPTAAPPNHRLLAWRGLTPRRVETASVQLNADSMIAHGASLTSDYALDYRLVTAHSWVTQSLDIRSRGEGWWRSLQLSRDDAGVWTAQWEGGGLRASGEAEPTLPALDGVDDCDIGLCPLTNTMPIRRYDLVRAAHSHAEISVELVMAFVAVPDLTVVASRQHYSSADPVADGGGALVRYSSERFATTLEVDTDGLVINYPGLGRRLDVSD